MNRTDISLLCLAILTITSAPVKSEPISGSIYIIANPAEFGSAISASTAEMNVNFADDNIADDDACTECYAAVEMKTYLSKCPGISAEQIRLEYLDELPSDGYIIILGSKRSNRFIKTAENKDAESPAFASDQSFRIKVEEKNGRTICVIEGASRIGTLYGAYEFLKQTGINFYGLGETGTSYPKDKTIMPKSLDITMNPSYLSRGFHAWEPRGNTDFFLWMARNRMNYWTAAEKNIPFLKKLGFRLAIGSHDIQTNFLNPAKEYPYSIKSNKNDATKPKDPYKASTEKSSGDANNDGQITYFEAHPEWFGLRGGKRSNKIQGGLGDNFCTSNDDAVAELSNNFTNGLIDGIWKDADVVNFWMEDGGKWCECEKCAAIGSNTDRLLRLIYQVNKVMQKARSEGRLKRIVHITSLAYSETIKPPTKPLPDDFDYENCSITFYPIQRCYNHTMSDSTCTERNVNYATNLLGWSPRQGGYYKGSLFIGEYYNVSNYKSMPAIYTKTMAADIPWYHNIGARHFQYMHTLTSGWGPWTLNQYLMSALTWSIDTNVDSLLDKYFADYYPTTSGKTREFYTGLEEALSCITWLKTYIPLMFQQNLDPLPFKHLQYDQREHTINSGISLTDTIASLQNARTALDASLLECANDVEMKRLLEDDKRLSYAENTVLFYYHMIRIYKAEKSNNSLLAKKEFQSAAIYYDLLKQYDRVFIETFGCPDDGQSGSFVTGNFNEYKKKYNLEEK